MTAASSTSPLPPSNRAAGSAKDGDERSASGTPRSERQPERLDADTGGRLPVARAAVVGQPLGGAVGEEVAAGHDEEQDRRGQGQTGEGRRAEAPDDGRVDQDVERFDGQRAEGRDGQGDDAAVDGPVEQRHERKVTGAACDGVRLPESEQVFDTGSWAGGTPRSRGPSSSSGCPTAARPAPRPGTPAATARRGRRKRQPYEAVGRPPGRAAVPYAELHCHSNFSFLDGASHPEELAEEAARLGLEALALTDHDGLLRRRALRRGGPGRRAAHGVRGRAHARRQHAAAQNGAARPAGPPPGGAGRRSPGLRRPGPRHQPGPAGRARRAPRSSPSEGLAGRGHRALVGAHRLPQGGGAGRAGGPRARRPPARAAAPAGRRPSGATGWPSSCGTTATRSTRPATTPWPSWPCGHGVACVATANAHYATPPRRPAGHRAGRGAGPPQPRRARSLAARPPAATCARAPSRPGASPATPAWWRRRPRSGGRCAFDLALVAPHLPPFPCPDGLDEMTYLRQLRRAEGARRRYGTRDGRPTPRPRPWPRSTTSSTVIEGLGFPGYFLVVWDIVQFCRARRHLLPGPGLGRQQRRLLRPRHHQRRRRRARPAVRALPVARARRAARHRPRHRERPAGGGHPVRLRALRARAHRPGGQRHHLPGPVGGAGHGQGARLRPRPAGRVVEAGRRLGPGGGHRSARPTTTSPPPCWPWPKQVEDFPRHLGIHSGGMVICDRPVIEVCPVEWARMEDRSVLQWDKDDCAAVGLVKFDLLGLGMLTALHEAVDLIARPPRATTSTSATIPDEDRRSTRCSAGPTPSACSRSRAGPRWPRCPGCEPRTFYDLVVEVALIRPGPIQGGSVHPYIRRRNGQEQVTYLHPLLEKSPGARRSACRCSRSSSCRWPSTWPASRPARPTSCARPWAPSAAASGWSSCARALRRHGRAGHHRCGRRRDLREDGGLRQLRLPREPLGVVRLPRVRVGVDQAARAGGVLRRAAQRPADGLLLAALAGAGRPPPRGGGAHPGPERARLAQAHARALRRLAPTVWPCASGIGYVRSIGRGPGQGDRRRAALRRPGGPRAPGAGAHPRPARGAGDGRGLRRASALDRREALWAVGAVAQSPARVGWPASSPGPTRRRCRA